MEGGATLAPEFFASQATHRHADICKRNRFTVDKKLAPEANLTSVDPTADLRQAIDIDSMDFPNFITAIHQRLGVDIPEIGYPKLITFNGAVAYLTAHLKSSAA